MPPVSLLRWLSTRRSRCSRRVVEKVGFVYERDFFDDEVLHVLYRLTAS
jgi:RimJ/RimL family protein N-acetyltransferase